MARKATHIGHCQACGRSQKLPGGTLSIHGYTVQWSMFLGTCPGTGHLPFEQSKDLVDGFIASALAQADALEAEAAGLRADTDPAQAWVHEYRPATWQNRKSSRVWRLLGRDDFQDDGRHYVREDGRKDQTAVYGARDLRAVMVALNERRAAFLVKEAQGFRQYAAWQQERIQDWKPQDLTPIN